MQKKEIDKAIRYLKKDEAFARVIKDFKKPDLGRADAYFKAETNYFKVLTRYIINQQISGKVARVIEDRFNSLFKKEVSPKNFKKLKPENVRTAGISPQKLVYLTDLADKFIDGTIKPANFDKMSDDDIREHLVSVKGIGRWTADMFLMFTLYRPDVLPTGDLGIQKGFKVFFKMRSLPDVKKMQKLAKPWEPYRTIASMYLWKLADDDQK